MKISDWEKSTDDDGLKRIYRNIISNNKMLEDKICCEIKRYPCLFNNGTSKDEFFCYVYLEREKAGGRIFRSYNPDLFKPFKTLFEAMTYIDLYLSEIQVLTLEGLSFSKEINRWFDE